MSTTDFERNDGLDDLTPEELEERAFGPDPDRRQGDAEGPVRAGPRGLVPAPGRTALSARPSVDGRLGGPSRNRALLLLGGAAVLLVLIVAALFFFDARGPGAAPPPPVPAEALPPPPAPPPPPPPAPPPPAPPPPAP